MSDNDAIVYYSNSTPVDPNKNLNVPPADRTVKDRFKEIDVALPSPLQVLANPEQAEARVRPLQKLGIDSSNVKTNLSQQEAERARVEYLAQKYENDRNYEEGRAPFAAAQGFVEGIFGVIVAPVKKLGEGAEPLTRAYASAGAGHYAFNLNDTNKDIANTQANAAQQVAVTQASGQVAAATVTADAGVQIAGIQSNAAIQATQITATSNQQVANINGRWGVQVAKNTGPSTVITNTNTNTNTNTSSSSSSAVASPETINDNRLNNRNDPLTINSLENDNHLVNRPETVNNLASSQTAYNNPSAIANPVSTLTASPSATANPVSTLTANPSANATGLGGAGGSATSNANPTVTATGTGYGGASTATGGSANLHNEVVLPAPPPTTN